MQDLTESWCMQHVLLCLVAQRIARGRERGDETRTNNDYIIQGCPLDKRVATLRPGGPIIKQHINPIHSNIITFVLSKNPSDSAMLESNSQH